MWGCLGTKNKYKVMIEGITYIEDFIENSEQLFDHLLANIEWDDRMKARKTASYGIAYNYSQMSYPYKEMLPEIEAICKLVKVEIGFEPNNCLVNLYADGNSRMGYHSDQIDILEEGTGIVIVSLGETRTLSFQRIENKEERIGYELSSGSLIYMNQVIQGIWQHAIPKSNAEKARMSLTLRRMK